MKFHLFSFSRESVASVLKSLEVRDVFEDVKLGTWIPE